MNKTVIGVPSGDHECFCFDVPEAEYIKFEGRSPKHYHESFFHEGLYRIHGIPDVPIFSLNGKYHSPKVLLEVEYDDYGVVSIKFYKTLGYRFGIVVLDHRFPSRLRNGEFNIMVCQF